MTRSVTFALEALTEEASQEFLAVLADGWTRVVVDDEGVRHFDATCILFLHPQRTSATPRLRPTVATAFRPTAVAWQCQQRHLADKHRVRYLLTGLIRVACVVDIGILKNTTHSVKIKQSIKVELLNSNHNPSNLIHPTIVHLT